MAWCDDATTDGGDNGLSGEDADSFRALLAEAEGMASAKQLQQGRIAAGKVFYEGKQTLAQVRCQPRHATACNHL